LRSPLNFKRDFPNATAFPLTLKYTSVCPNGADKRFIREATMSDYQKILFEMDGDVAIITMNDIATMNACGVDTAIELTDAFDRAAKSARAVILTGNGRGFCSGANLGNPAMASGEKAMDAGAALESTYNPLVTKMRDLPIPFVTAINGAAAGVGCSFALLGDMILASETAYFLQAFRRIGLVPDGGSTYMLTRAVGRARAMEMMLLGEKVFAPQALEWGLVNRVTSPETLLDEAKTLAHALATGPTKTLSMIRQMAWAGLDNSWQEQLALERTLQRDAGRTNDFKIGVKAFLTKQVARFTGS
jgi:2-(1,2-epoxy-1,2-dihydrophenyl)acetyl-CoA isomerase